MPSGIYEHKSSWNKGKKIQCNTGRTHFKSNHIPWNKGKTYLDYSDEIRKILSESHKGKHLSEEHKRNIGKAGEGHLVSIETRKKIGKAHQGSKNWSWQGGISFEPYTAEFNKQLKELIRNRDNYQCQLCGMPEIENITKLTVHHIDYVKKNCLPDNLIALCKSCNFKVNSNREYWMEYFKLKGF